MFEPQKTKKIVNYVLSSPYTSGRSYATEECSKNEILLHGIQNIILLIDLYSGLQFDSDSQTRPAKNDESIKTPEE